MRHVHVRIRHLDPRQRADLHTRGCAHSLTLTTCQRRNAAGDARAVCSHADVRARLHRVRALAGCAAARIPRRGMRPAFRLDDWAEPSPVRHGVCRPPPPAARIIATRQVAELVHVSGVNEDPWKLLVVYDAVGTGAGSYGVNSSVFAAPKEFREARKALLVYMSTGRAPRWACLVSIPVDHSLYLCIRTSR
ncbi:hypothetical protein DFH06DRAFT_324619 [Mycena polygramma]|nr:hypothetical protein DFH06DRAFT_324619 [Mycena polygramma]